MKLGSLKDCQAISHNALISKGFTEKEINLIEDSLASAFDIKFVFNQFTLGAEFCKDKLGMSSEQMNLLGDGTETPRVGVEPAQADAAAMPATEQAAVDAAKGSRAC